MKKAEMNIKKSEETELILALKRVDTRLKHLDWCIENYKILTNNVIDILNDRSRRLSEAATEMEEFSGKPSSDDEAGSEKPGYLVIQSIRAMTGMDSHLEEFVKFGEEIEEARRDLRIALYRFEKLQQRLGIL